MTRDEAIEMLRYCAARYQCLDFDLDNCHRCNQRIAQDMGIQALECIDEDVIHCGDCDRMKEVTKGSGTLFYWCRIQRHSVELNDFCSWGHPREIHDADK